MEGYNMTVFGELLDKCYSTTESRESGADIHRAFTQLKDWLKEHKIRWLDEAPAQSQCSEIAIKKASLDKDTLDKLEQYIHDLGKLYLWDTENHFFVSPLDAKGVDEAVEPDDCKQLP